MIYCFIYLVTPSLPSITERERVSPPRHTLSVYRLRWYCMNLSYHCLNSFFHFLLLSLKRGFGIIASFGHTGFPQFASWYLCQPLWTWTNVFCNCHNLRIRYCYRWVCGARGGGHCPFGLSSQIPSLLSITKVNTTMDIGQRNHPNTILQQISKVTINVDIIISAITSSLN